MPHKAEVQDRQLILISACLIGEPVRHDGRHAQVEHAIIHRWREEGRLRVLCPALGGGLTVPRPAVEIEPGQDGSAVLVRLASVADRKGRDYSRNLVAGAVAAARLALSEGVRIAVLKDGSASCGSQFIFSGTFDGVRVARAGVTTAALLRAGLSVFSEHQIDEAARLIDRLEGRST